MRERKLPRKKKMLTVGSLLVLAGLILVFNHTCFSGFTPSRNIPPEAQTDFALMAEAWNTIQKVYVDRSALKPLTITHGAIGGMVDSLGDFGHSSFMTKDMIRQEQEFAEGRYKGVGLELRLEKGNALIVAPMDGSPAQKAGLRSGEIITKVDGKSLIGLNMVQIVKLILGPAGTRVTLTVFDPVTDSSSDVGLTRATIHVENVRWKRLPGTAIAQLRIAALSNGVTEALRKSLYQIRVSGMKSIILDLRNDPGGLLDEAVGCTSQFLKDGNVLLEKNSAGEIRQVPVRHEAEATPLPLVVLVNEGTASAAEIIAGAIQDAGRAKLVGKKTFGTGTVLQQFDLSDGSALMLAVEEWLTPKGDSIWHQGISPDFDVGLPAGVHPLLPDEQTGLTPSKLMASGDDQLLKAVAMLSGEQK